MHYMVHAFGSDHSYLDIDFNNPAQSELAARIVANCLWCDNHSVDENEVWSWSLKRRLQALLEITMVTQGGEMLLQVRCSNRLCDEDIELPLDLERFRQDVNVDEFSFSVDSTEVMARLPNGSDQQRWLQSPVFTPSDIARELVLRIGDRQPGDDWQFPEAWLPDFSESLERQDELMTLEISSSCPVCENELNCAVDLETQLLASLALEQQKLLLEVHQLALAYHWSEAAICRLTPARRKFYLAQIRDLVEGASLQ